MSAEKALLDVMTLLHLDTSDREEDEDMELLNVEALSDNASAQYNTKRSAIQKGLKVNTNTERRRPGPKSFRARPDNSRQIVSTLNEEIIALQKEESALVNETINSCHAQDLNHLVKEPSTNIIPVESTSQKLCKRAHEKTYFQAVLLQQLCRMADVPDEKQDYIDKLCNSVLTEAYDFTNS